LRPRPPVGPRMLVTPPRPRGRQPPASGRRAGPRNLREGILARQLFPHSTSQTADRSSTVSTTPASTARMPATMRRIVLRFMLAPDADDGPDYARERSRPSSRPQCAPHKRAAPDEPETPINGIQAPRDLCELPPH